MKFEHNDTQVQRNTGTLGDPVEVVSFYQDDDIVVLTFDDLRALLYGVGLVVQPIEEVKALRQDIETLKQMLKQRGLIS